MGCMLESDVSRGGTSSEACYEERTISAFERELPFNYLDFTTVANAVKSHTVGELTSTSELKVAWTALGIATDPNLELFAGLFHNSDGKVSRRTLLLGILLIAEVSAQVKAEWLFDSSSSAATMTKTEVETLIQQIISVSCEALPKLATGDSPDHLAPSQVNAYLAPVWQAQSSLVEQLSSWLLTGPEVLRSDFILRMCNPRGACSALLTSSGTRTVCIRLLASHSN